MKRLTHIEASHKGALSKKPCIILYDLKYGQMEARERVLSYFFVIFADGF